MLRPGGFPEYSPAEQLVFDQVKTIIEQIYEQHGYAHIQTPAVEANSVLLSKNGEDAGKQIFGLYGLAQGAEDNKDYSLHFDLTVPFARYVLDWENQLTFPFKRFQVQPARRGERSQRGRFKELWQADVDVIWQELEKPQIGKNLYYDAEMMIVIAKTLHKIIEKFISGKSFTLHINNRYLLAGVVEQFSEEKRPLVYSLLDKYYKITNEQFIKEAEELLDKDSKKLLDFVVCKLEDLGSYGLDNDNFKRGVVELQEVFGYIKALNPDNKYKLVFDPYIIRGLDYYTGTVYESFFDDDMALGSISSGGRYENLTGYINPKKSHYSGVGGSIGLSRIVYLILEKYKPENLTKTNYLFVNFKETTNEIGNLMNKYLDKGEFCELYPSADKLGKQFTYADKKGIPYVVILGEGEKKEGIYKIKNMKTGEEKISNL
ncbi:MAG: ATP phosphoribosyltransferase regulatory subunit [Candidatus Absconditabacteria bacterium]|nr:ATP phosphoribosyltransferase regulatory subunit [Candidatus Absconditabacteria bacterium]